MVISYFGGEFFKVTFGDTTLAFNPVSKDSKLKTTRFGADIALVTLNHEDLNGIDQVTHGEKKPLVITGPGEYEVKDIFIKGFPSQSSYGGTPQLNTVYAVTLEGMTLLFLGALGSKKIDADLRGMIDVVDVLFVPIGGNGVLSASDAHELSVLLEPHIVIPMHYGEIGNRSALQTFLKEEGDEKLKPIEKLTLKPKDLVEKEGEGEVLAS